MLRDLVWAIEWTSEKKNTGSSVELQIEWKTVEKGPSYYKYLSQNQGTGTEHLTYLYSLIPCHAKWNKKKNGCLNWSAQPWLLTHLSSHSTLILMAFLNLNSLLRCLLVPFAIYIIYTKNGLELCVFYCWMNVLKGKKLAANLNLQYFGYSHEFARKVNFRPWKLN